MKSKLLPVVGLVVVSIVVTLGTTGMPDRAQDSVPRVIERLAMAPDDALAIVASKSTPTLPLSTESGGRTPARMLAVSADTWVVMGHVRRGTFGSYARAPLSLRLYSGTEVTDDPLVEIKLRADENGDFAWVSSPPSGTVLVEVIPDLEDHKVGASTRVVPPGDAAPDDLAPYAYSLDTRILGRVIDEDGAPISGARVISHLSETVTATNGEYSLLMDSTYPVPTISAVAVGFARSVVAVGSFRPGDVPADDLVLHGDYAVEGQVMDEHGNPISGATVRTSRRERNQTLTDGMGRFRLGRLDPTKERATVSARMEGYVTASARVGPDSAASPVEIVLHRGGRISGRVMTADGEPVSGATVSVGNHPSSTGVLSRRTDAEGSFSIAVVPAGRQSVWAIRGGYCAGRVAFSVPEGGAPVVGLEVVLGTGYRVAGTVLDEDGEPVPGARIRAEPTGNNFGAPGFVSPTTMSDTLGRFQFDSLRKGRVGLRVWAEGCSELLEAVAAGRTDVILRPVRAGRLAGRVLDGRTGEPVESFVVRFVYPDAPLDGRRLLTGHGAAWYRPGMSFVGTDGFWTSGLEALEMGGVTGIEVSAPGYTVGLIGHAEVVQDPAPDGLLVELVSGTRLTGFVIDATGMLVPGARVRRFTDGDLVATRRYVPDPRCTAKSDENGRFTMPCVPSGSMYLFADGPSLPLVIDGPFEVPPHARSMERMIVAGSEGRLTGRLLRGDGGVLPGEKVSLKSLNLPDDTLRFEATTDADGSFSFERLVPARYYLSWALTHGGRTVGRDLLRLVEIEADRTLEYDLRPQGRATLRGTIVFDGKLPDDFTVKLRPRQKPNALAENFRAVIAEDREFVATYLEPGEWTVQVLVQADGQRMRGQAKVQVPPDGTVSVSVPLRARKR